MNLEPVKGKVDKCKIPFVIECGPHTLYSYYTDRPEHDSEFHRDVIIIVMTAGVQPPVLVGNVSANSVNQA